MSYVLVKIMTIKLHNKSILIQLQQILWTCCVFLSSINNTFFSVLVIIFSNKSYFYFNYRNTFFIHAMNYISVLLRIIFLYVYWELFFHWAENYFSRYREFIFGPTTLRALQLKWTGSSLWLPWATILKTFRWSSAFKENAKAKRCQGKKQKRFWSFLQNLSARSQ